MKILEKLKSLLKKKSLKNSVYYNSVYDCPISEWDLSRTFFNSAFLKKENLNKMESEVEKDDSEEGKKVYLKLLDQIWLKFGQDSKTKEILEIKRELVELYSDMIQNNDRFLINFIEPLKKTLSDLEEKEEGKEETLFSEELGIVGKNFNSLIDPKTTSIYQYYTAASTLKNG